MKNKTEYNKIVKSVFKEHKKKIIDSSAIPLFTLFIAPCDIKDRKDEQMQFGYFISGEEKIGLGVILENLKGIINEIETNLCK